MRRSQLAYAAVCPGKQGRKNFNGIAVNVKAPIKITRDLEVVQIPEGYQVRLARGTEVRATQALGDTFTVMTEYGTMVRIAGKDADAIGETVMADPCGTADQSGTADKVLTDR